MVEIYVRNESSNTGKVAEGNKACEKDGIKGKRNRDKMTQGCGNRDKQVPKNTKPEVKRMIKESTQR